jgi:hypothetical protein
MLFPSLSSEKIWPHQLCVKVADFPRIPCAANMRGRRLRANPSIGSTDRHIPESCNINKEKSVKRLTHFVECTKSNYNWNILTILESFSTSTRNRESALTNDNLTLPRARFFQFFVDFIGPKAHLYGSITNSNVMKRKSWRCTKQPKW